MIFNSVTFLCFFLPTVFAVNCILRKTTYSNIWLLFASLLFYAWGEPYYVLLLVISILFNWITGILIEKSKKPNRQIIFISGIIFNLGLLGYFKYFKFILSVINTLSIQHVFNLPDIALPIGISFFTFQAISYIADVYQGKTNASHNLVNVALYISFFPQLIAGPIVQYRRINQQIESRKITCQKIAIGFKRFIYGLAKKVLIANITGACADTIFSYNVDLLNSQTAWLGALAYTLQIYYDFSGYSDMAIGLSKIFGFNIMENFQYPYLSNSITEFWRKWHISLGSWFREYVYIPLGGNHKGSVRTCINLFITFFLTGIWHGADFSFILWGIYHGFFIIIEKLGLKKKLDKFHILSPIYCFIILNFGWVLFRAKNTRTGLQYILHMIFPWKYTINKISVWNYIDKKTIFAIVCGIAGIGFMKKFIPANIQNKWQNSTFEAIYCIIMLILCIASIAGNTYNPFIYFQF